MIEEKKLSREISDVSWGLFTTMLEYKASWYGRALIKVDTYFPSSKKCSGCGNVKEELKLSQRQYNCDKCNASLDRDYNAALNILQEGLRTSGIKIPAVPVETTDNGPLNEAGNKRLTIKHI